jgi:hypothetical protein
MQFDVEECDAFTQKFMQLAGTGKPPAAAAAAAVAAAPIAAAAVAPAAAAAVPANCKPPLSLP